MNRKRRRTGTWTALLTGGLCFIACVSGTDTDKFQGDDQPDCYTNANCEQGNECSGGECIPYAACGSDLNCRPDEYCIDGACRNPCTSNSHCASGLDCRASYCLPRPNPTPPPPPPTGGTGNAGTSASGGSEPTAGSGLGGANPGGSGGAGAVSGAGNVGGTGVAGAGNTGGTSLGGSSTGGQGGVTSGGGTSGSASGGTSSGGTAQGGTASGGTSGTSSGGTGNVMEPPPINNGTPAWASRYWDCCKPACGWTANVRVGNGMPTCDINNNNQGTNGNRNACEGGGNSYMCWNGVPWQVTDRLSYGFAAASGGNYVCGRCYQLQFTGSGHHGNNAGATSLNGKTMIVQVINNGGVASDQFDLLIPGGGVGDFNACSTQWGTSDLGAQYGGFLAGCNGDRNCVQQKCQQVFSGKAELQQGCDWFLGWFNMADNPNLVYQQIACPAAITQRSGLADPG